MKRRKTVSVTPAMGARTVAGEMVTVPMWRVLGTGRSDAAWRTGVSAAHVPELSQNLRMGVFYLFCADFRCATIVANWSLRMRTIREILLTEYIGAILVAVLIADALTTLVTTAVTQTSYYIQVQHNPMLASHRLSPAYSVLDALVKIAIYLIVAYLIAGWLYPAKTGKTQSNIKTGEAV